MRSMRRRGALFQGGAMARQTAAFPPTCGPWCSGDGVRPVRLFLSSRACRGIWVGRRGTLARGGRGPRPDPSLRFGMTCEWRQKGQASTFLSQSGSEWVPGAPIEHVREIKRSLEAEVADAAVHVYPGAGHGFFWDGKSQLQWRSGRGCLVEGAGPTSAGICAAPATSSGA